MISILNPTKLTRQPFFNDLIQYLAAHDEVTLRQLKQVFSHVSHLERSIEAYVQAGYIKRKDKRYCNQFTLVTDTDHIQLDQQIFVDTDSSVYEELLSLTFQTELGNQTNEAVIVEQTGISREEPTLSNYFYKLREGLPLSDSQQPLYQLLGDVNQEYALKYMTTFLLKFGRKDVVKQKRPDIFVQALELLGYLEKSTDDNYELRMVFDKQNLVFSSS
ncbi:DUF1803 domain-containing protein [Streptococcus ferus]|uniref:Hypothetical cytosolic protein n=1 Tax=Streptococcus ferus TaxID=1345 RepID=A0A2X3VNC7_9STRE|nr:DUF1803 domain-containing protein [Streptococcus ferus]SQF40908.1 hypothetical cytosolic protein [Streptococcus ferus]